jgi:hypothetical protein
MDDHEQRMECAKEFERIRERIDRLDNDSRAQSDSIARVETNIVNLTASMDRLTTAIWGIVIGVAGLGVMFIIGRI